MLVYPVQTHKMVLHRTRSAVRWRRTCGLCTRWRASCVLPVIGSDMSVQPWDRSTVKVPQIQFFNVEVEFLDKVMVGPGVVQRQVSCSRDAGPWTIFSSSLYLAVSHSLRWTCVSPRLLSEVFHSVFVEVLPDMEIGTVFNELFEKTVEIPQVLFVVHAAVNMHRQVPAVRLVITVQKTVEFPQVQGYGC